MHQRLQQTISKTAEVAGIGFLTGADVTLRFLPASPNSGIAFQRVDKPDSEPIPARLEYTVPRQRRTAIEKDGVAVEMVEHVMAALAGLQIDNCLVQLDAPEPPGCDGSARDFAQALLNAGIVEQEEPQPLIRVGQTVCASNEVKGGEILARPLTKPTLAISYHLDYGSRSPIPPQNLTVEITPQSFLEELVFARTFILESEADALRAQGYGKRTTARDLIIFGEEGIIDNSLRIEDECVRHKILDCIGDFALIGCDLQGHFSAFRSGHQLNQEIIRRLKQAQLGSSGSSNLRAA